MIQGVSWKLGEVGREIEEIPKQNTRSYIGFVLRGKLHFHQHKLTAYATEYQHKKLTAGPTEYRIFTNTD